MVKHIVLWNFNQEMSEKEKLEAGAKIKTLLEPIKDMVEGTIAMRVVINKMESSNRDILLIADFESEEALKAYQLHPAHVAAGKYIGTVTYNRSCLDYEV